jgi:hypothetical protein
VSVQHMGRAVRLIVAIGQEVSPSIICTPVPIGQSQDELIAYARKYGHAPILSSVIAAAGSACVPPLSSATE